MIGGWLVGWLVSCLVDSSVPFDQSNNPHKEQSDLVDVDNSDTGMIVNEHQDQSTIEQ